MAVDPIAELRWLRATGLPAPAAGAVVAVALAASYALMAWALGMPMLEVGPDSDPRFAGNAWSACVVSALLGFVFAVPEYSVERNGRDVEALGHVVPGHAPGEARERWLEATLDRRGLRRITWLGAFLGLVTWSVPLVRYVLPDPTTDTLAVSGWFLLTVPLLYTAFLRATYVTANGMRHLPRGLEVDLLDQRVLAPFARIGLRNAVMWLLAGSLVLSFAVSIPWGDLWTTFPALICIVTMAAAALVVPVLRARSEILEVKRRELERTDAELREAVSALRAGGDEVRAAARLQGVVAWRSVVASTNEWPVDAPTVVRFALYLIIPVMGWLAGALVERGLDLFLG